MAVRAHDEPGTVRGTATTNRTLMLKTFATGPVRPSGLQPAVAAAAAVLLALALAACTRPASPARAPRPLPVPPAPRPPRPRGTPPPPPRPPFGRAALPP